jgi:transposase
LADDRGRPVAFALTPGNVADITMAIPLLAAVDKPKRLLADKAYDADSFRNWLKRRKIKAVIPSPLPDGPHTRSIKRPIGAAMSSSACSAS